MERDPRSNPFQTLYLTEALTDPDVYWDLFSPHIVTGEARQLFQPGNVVLLGSNGTGKTMLLRLFAPAVQAAYLRKNKELPIPEESRRFLSIGVNFVTAGVSEFGGRRVSEDQDDNLMLWGLYFGDFLNYFFVSEFMSTLEFLCGSEGKVLTDFLGVKLGIGCLDEFAGWLARNECWFGALNRRSTFQEVQQALRDRLSQYRAFANWNIDTLPGHLTSTKTDMGVPLIECRKGLRVLGAVDDSVPLMVTIDQYETLLHRDYETAGSHSVGRTFLRVVNTIMASRSPEVSYKVGVRPYSWDREMRTFGTDARLEHVRDYQKVNLDDLLRRKENRASWIFPEFAGDVAGRRIAKVLGGEAEQYKSWLIRALEELPPEEELARYCASDDTRLLPRHVEWPNKWNKLLAEIYFHKGKFDAKLAEIWVYQEMGRTGEVGGEGGDWDKAFTRADWEREWWQKERREALLMQIASSCRQRRLYGGWDIILTLSGDNILVFLSLCKEIWDIHERARSTQPDVADGAVAEVIGIDVQTQAIRSVSESWLKKQGEFPDGSRRQDFIRRLGVGVRRALIADKGLIYPGHNGFSLLVEEYESDGAADVRKFLANAVDFGALISTHHTTKERDKRPRRKWYIFPILCPNFEIPAIRTKEPYYASLQEVRHWIGEDRPPILLRRPRENRPRSNSQASLFPDEEDM
jgi:hypothetical protein